MITGFFVVHAVIVNVTRRKITVEHEHIVLHAGRQDRRLSISKSSPIIVRDSEARKGLRRIRLLCDDADFKMVVTEEESQRLAAWAAGDPAHIMYRRDE